jgi:hypothetical protein
MSRRHRLFVTPSTRSADLAVRLVGGALATLFLTMVLIVLLGSLYGKYSPRPPKQRTLECDHYGKVTDCHPRWQDFQ